MEPIRCLRIKNKSLESLSFERVPKEDLTRDSVYWFHLSSKEDRDFLFELGSKVEISPLVLEKALETNQLPRLEDYKDYIFMVLERIELGDDARTFSKGLSLILAENLLITVEDSPSSLFKTIMNTLVDRVKLFDTRGDDIFYLVLDRTLENYFNALEKLGERIDEVEDELLLNPQKATLNEIYRLKKDLIDIRKTLWLMRNAIGRLERSEFILIGRENQSSFKILYDHIVQLVDLTETYRDICSGMLDIYLSSLSNKTNDIMKILTIYSTLFIPLTFLAGVYGMNFKNFPELYWKYGYLSFWVISLIITAFMIRFFKKKDWL